MNGPSVFSTLFAVLLFVTLVAVSFIMPPPSWKFLFVLALVVHAMGLRGIALEVRDR